MRNIDLKEFLKKAKNFSPRHYIPHDIENVWIFILFLFSLLTVILLVAGTLLFLRISSDGETLYPRHGENDVSTINRTELENLLDALRTRSDVFEKMTEVIVEPVEREEPGPDDEVSETGGTAE